MTEYQVLVDYLVRRIAEQTGISREALREAQENADDYVESLGGNTPLASFIALIFWGSLVKFGLSAAQRRALVEALGEVPLLQAMSLALVEAPELLAAIRAAAGLGEA